MPAEFEDLMREVDAPPEPETEKPETVEEVKVETPETTETETETEEENAPEAEETQQQTPPNPAKEALEGQKVRDKVSPDDKSAKAFAEMRVKATSYERALQRAADLEGLSVEEYLQKLDQKDIERRAKETNMDPEVLKRIEVLERERQEVLEMKARYHIENQFKVITEKYGASQDELLMFTADLQKQGFNFFDLNVNYETLYKGMNYEKLIEKERQKWIARAEKGSSAGSVMSKNGKTSDKGAKVETMNDLEDLLSGME